MQMVSGFSRHRRSALGEPAGTGKRQNAAAIGRPREQESRATQARESRPPLSAQQRTAIIAAERGSASAWHER
jgi:hypothetical protein